MKLTKDQYLAQLETHLQSQQEATTGVKVQQPAALKRGLSFVLDQLNSGYLGQYEWSVRLRKGTPVSIRLEMNLINVPVKDAARLDGKLLENEPTYGVNLYMVAEGDELNKSGLRIDLLADEAQLATASPAALVKGLQEWVAAQLAQTMENRTAE